MLFRLNVFSRFLLAYVSYIFVHKDSNSVATARKFQRHTQALQLGQPCCVTEAERGRLNHGTGFFAKAKRKRLVAFFFGGGRRATDTSAHMRTARGDHRRVPCGL